MISKKDVTELYLQYGFEEGPSCDQYLVFFSQSGYFQNAEIVILEESFDSNTIDKAEYENLGYSVRIKKFTDIIAVHNALFNGFFDIEHSNRRLLSEYNSFCEQQSRKLANNRYEYISGEYVENGILQHSNIIDRILQIFSSDGCQLVILEASAGYGKTCTSFETIRHLIENIPTKIPLLAELSKNRKAGIFRYVLLSEIDQKFPMLSSELVTNEILDGRIFLIIDGFDELLSKGYSSQKDAEKAIGKDAQTMLDTIAQLIPNSSNTKILLTSRKSSIFVGEDFDNWVTERLGECNITRLQLSQPSLRDWIGAEKIEILKAQKITLSSIQNPVLLTLLRNEPIESFKEKYTSNDQMIKEYLTLLLKRERTRQSLLLDVDEQIFIMSELAAQMVRYDISSENVDFIKALLLEIVEPNIKIYLDRYDSLPDASETKPSEAEFLTKLSQHALLDRLSTHNNLIGFINEFIFGLMIAEAITRNFLSIDELEGKYLDIVVTAYSSYSPEKRRVLYDEVTPILYKQNAQRRLGIETHLLETVVGNYAGEYFDGVFFGKNLKILKPSAFKECMFIDCVFDQCQINTDAFLTCHFYNCSFYNNTILPGHILECELTFLSCTGYEDFALLAHREESVQIEDVNYERIVLEQFWKPGYENAEPYRAYHSLLKGISSNNRKFLVDAIESLVKKNILIKRMRVYELNFEKMNVIKDIVGR